MSVINNLTKFLQKKELNTGERQRTDEGRRRRGGGRYEGRGRVEG